MSLPNVLSFSRILLGPLFLLAFSFRDVVDHPAYIVVLVVAYVYLEVSDVLDGWIARKYNLVTELGKVLDPFADVISRLTFFLCFVQAGLFPVVLFALILYRELGITFLRSLMFRRGISVAANYWGKAKAVGYTVASLAGFTYVFTEDLGFSWFSSPVFRDGLTWIFVAIVIASLVSFLTYLQAFLRQGESGR